jgi:L-cystine transport system permease protein
VFALVIGVIIGFVAALARFYGVPLLSQVLQVLITLLKGVPIVLILLAMYLLASTQFDIWAKALHISLRFKDFNTIWLAVIGLSIMAFVNASEIFRGAFASIGVGQLDAAKSIGMTNWQTIRRVLLPQAIPVSIPVFGNLLINLIKASALASMVGVVDIFSAATISAQQTYTFLEAYAGVALIYWAVVVCIEKGSGLIEHRMTRHLGRAAQ